MGAESALCSVLGTDPTQHMQNASGGHGFVYNSSDAPPLFGDIFTDNTTTAVPTLERIKFYISGIVTPTLCSFGIVGNILNIVVLTRRRLQAALECSMERAAYLGLIALAISDMLYCIISLPCSFLSPKSMYTEKGFWLYTQMYARPLQNIFMNTSTWLTVIMAAARYAAICRPLHARYLVEVKATRLAVVLTFILCAGLQAPSFWSFVVSEVRCPGGSYYILSHGYFVETQPLKLCFTILWFVLGYFIPVIIMSFCNVHLIKALRESFLIRKLYRVSPKPVDVGAHITPTLVAIVCLFIIFVSPSEILHFCFYYIRDPHAEAFMVALVAANALHTLNFAINFALYCIVNVHFRETWIGMLYCRAKREYAKIQRRQVATQSNGSSKSFLYNSIALETVV